VRILVTGGAGYIGSFVCRMLQDDGHDIVAVDNLVYGHRQAVSGALEVGDLRDASFLDGVFDRYRPEAVMHLAAWIEVGESVREPAKYFVNNTGGTALLLQAMVCHGVPIMVFSSTAAVYGTPERVPLAEASPKRPDSPYGMSKLLSEMSFPAFAQANDLRTVSLRYFNAAGAALDGSSGEAHEPATHLITNAIHACLGQQEFTLFGTDYDTPDGTCVRDYVHVLDIAQAHVIALRHLVHGGAGTEYNVGAGHGYTNLEVIDAVKRISGIDFPVKRGARRPGDPPALVADASLLQADLGWKPVHSNLSTIVESSWKWQSTHPRGYEDM
jgi:UDP-glucose-4-epimerase GalE